VLPSHFQTGGRLSGRILRSCPEDAKSVGSVTVFSWGQQEDLWAGSLRAAGWTTDRRLAALVNDDLVERALGHVVNVLGVPPVLDAAVGTYGVDDDRLFGLA